MKSSLEEKFFSNLIKIDSFYTNLFLHHDIIIHKADAEYKYTNYTSFIIFNLKSRTLD